MNTKNEWQRKQAQARRALHIEMYMNAEMLRAVAEARAGSSGIQKDTGDFLQGVLGGREFREAFRSYFTEATESASWEDMAVVLGAYGTGQVTFEGTLLRKASTDTVVKLYNGSATRFCDAIGALRKYEKMPNSFYEKVDKIRKECAATDSESAGNGA